MTPPDKIRDLDDIRVWIAEHEGRTSAWWKSQFADNRRNEEAHEEIRRVLERLERRVVYAAGFASAIGVVAGFLLQKVVL